MASPISISKCSSCGAELAVGRRSKAGRPARYCSNVCRQRAYRRRGKTSVETPDELPELPSALDEFVGRAEELTQLRSRLRSARLLTLVGPGGAGKTRLALELARQIRGDRVGLAELDSLSDGDLLPHVVAVALGIGERNGTSMHETLCQALGRHRTLLVLDNCEHLVHACARLADVLLRRCPGLRILATSRESLRVPGESLFRVGELSLPKSDDIPALLRSDAVQLFTRRAQACDLGFELTADNARAVAEICRQADGLPLAIELVARRVGSLPLDHILAGMDDQFTMLTEGCRTAPERHHELRSTIGWSYHLLDPAEQAVLRRLAVLPGGFSLDGASAVCADSDLGQDAVPRLVHVLEAKSLVVADSGAGPPARFRLLNAIRTYGLERLEAAGELTEAKERAADWLAGQIPRPAGPQFHGEQLTDKLQHELDNLAAAVDHTAVRPDDRHLLLAMALACLWLQRDHWTTGRQVLANALERVADSSYHVNAIALAARMATLQVDHSEGLRLAERAMTLARARADVGELADATDTWALALTGRQDFAGAVASYRDCLELVRSLNRPQDIAFCQKSLAWTLFRAGELTEAGELMDACLPGIRAFCSDPYLASALHTVGLLRLTAGDLVAAEAAFVEELCLTPKDSRGVAFALEGLAIVAGRRGELHRCLCFVTVAAELRRQINIPLDAEWLHRVEETASKARNGLGPAGTDAALAASRHLQGERLLSCVRREPSRQSQKDPLLTERELEVVTLVAEGLTNREIAARLRLSPSTVATHLNHVRDKVGKRSRIQIALWAKTHYEDFRNADNG
ncbi:LuxR C-terminal-related transcriptional regulator [Allokutzneria sp. A3M-2-11 16]|uniref:LuxR C-terminal-related transcriptional regulator n=1 Tax=Allokutzneria sp. A3M-2-11 16 TaxID=2962043 RepID=UPI0020B89282|nr:LuxR C-terminal-related transcriptional regulator [Allokutzneria sp. A3M-2-11 16]MCP3803412.1 LuxR C-terminal-related transcriptional regulator [Allokutzneria sp. A3M-2-11 16]